MAKDDVSVRIPKEMANDLDQNVGEGKDFENRTKAVEHFLEKGLKASNGNSFELDNQTPQKFFSYLTGKKASPWNEDLADQEFTERELIDMALEISGKRYEDLLKEALIQRAKEEISLGRKRAYDDANGMGSVDSKLQKAFAELTEEMMAGRYNPRGGRLKISAVASRAVVNLNTAKKWAQNFQPELLD